MKHFCLHLFIACLCLSASSLRAQVKLASLFTDNMVLQQQSKVGIWGWASPGKNIRVTPSWSNKAATTRADNQGKWRVYLTTPVAGGPYSITVHDGQPTVLKNVMIGEVWLCSGQSNMEMPLKGFRGQPIIGSNDAILKSANKNIRVYTVPRSVKTSPQDTSKKSEWKEATPETISNFSATAYFFGKDLHELLNVPIGLINDSYGGSPVEAFMDAATLREFPEIKLPTPKDSATANNRTPTTLYNGMIHPVVGYGIKGFIWYQGESNQDRAAQYETLFPAMVKQWRREWGNDSLPFYFAQIAPFNYNSLPNGAAPFNSAHLRDAHRKAVGKIANSGMAVLMDIGEEKNIHPAAKKQVGERLALLALAKTYGLKGFGFESSAYDTLVISNGIADVKFKNAENWLTSYGKELALFEVAGKDKIFYPAKGVIYRSSVMVSSPQVKEPVAVRYAFKDFTVGELFSTEGLPVSSFRTDNW
ncbi:MAG TPA: sialate O-acetylesterase [Flavisolibacter sp.]|nr:sialate O-acetylesterase [Flavisolibacter sp.]